MKSRKSALRTVDVARRAGYSVQQVRNLENEGVLPSAFRSDAGYRAYSEAHVQAALAYRDLAAGVGPVEAKHIMRATAPLALIDAAHARLHTEREGLRLARNAALVIAGETVDDALPSDSMSISELATALGIRASNLRHWEAEGLIRPARSTSQRVRVYSPSDVRDARIVQQLRLAGYRIPQLRELMPQLRDGEVMEALVSREASLNLRSRHLALGAARLLSTLD